MPDFGVCRAFMGSQGGSAVFRVLIASDESTWSWRPTIFGGTVPASSLASQTAHEPSRLATLEGPQRADLAPDIALALDASPSAGAFFDSLAQFYRTAWLRWIDSTKRRPDQRPIRIDEMVRLLQMATRNVRSLGRCHTCRRRTRTLP
jgi:hypothetical protein